VHPFARPRNDTSINTCNSSCEYSEVARRGGVRKGAVWGSHLTPQLFGGA
jgi:hypothetical protein